ncbi:MAG: hypothetical protein OXR72_03180 [Gemmatimonadota bacterium]|nr:hypothetical protein [Gemmatimonadota bacterium]
MKIGALILTVTMVFIATTPFIAQTASPLRGAQKADTAVEAAIRMLHTKAVTVMSGEEVDLNRLYPGLYAYVVFKFNEAEGAAMGRIVASESSRVVIAPGEGKGWEILRRDIVHLAVADNPGGIELWRMARREMLEGLETATSELSGENPNLENLRIGSHVHVVYRTPGISRTATGVITGIDANHIEIKSGKKPGVRQKIRAGDVERILSFRKRGEMDRWRNARKAMRDLQGPRVRLKAPSISPHWMIGRFAGAVRDTLEVLSERGAERIHHASVRTLEVSMGRHRNTIKGMAIGALAGLGSALLIYPYDAFDDERRGEVEERDRADRFFYAVLVVPLATVCGTLVGGRTITEKWVEVHPSRINLSISPTRNNGLRAALSFHF